MGELLHSHFDQIPATLTKTFRHVSACKTSLAAVVCTELDAVCQIWSLEGLKLYVAVLAM
jgi:hypothetical protein